MNAAAVLAACAAILQLAMGLLLLRLARAPGWAQVRSFAAMALTASAYSGANMFFAIPSGSETAVLVASRVNYLAASLHCAAWLVYSHGGPTASIKALPTPLKALAAFLISVGVVILFTGAHYVPGEWAYTSIEWAGVEYRSPTLRPWADWYGIALMAALLVPFTHFFRLARAGEVGALAHLVGFALFFGCGVVELLVASRVISTFYPADFGFLAMVVPVAGATVRRVVEDAGRLHALSQHLKGEVLARTEALGRAELALVEAERHAALGRLAAGVGHEINNPLTYVGLSLDVLDGWATAGAVPPNVREAIDSARDGTDRIRRVVDGLRVYTRTTAGESRPLDAGSLVKSALQVAAHQIQHLARIHVALGTTPPVLGDEARLVQVLVNLLTNAAQAIGESGARPLASITILTRVDDTGFVVLEVVDTGPGISPENVQRLAQPYFTTRAGTGGTGLGLYLARGIVEQHGGRLEITSELGVGTTARVLLPPAAPAEATADAPVPLPIEPLPPVARRRVLVVDDEPLLTRLLSRTLAPHFDVVTANSADEAMVRLREGAFDAVLCDLMMPGASGIDLAERIARDHEPLSGRILFMTGGAVTPDTVAFLERPDVRHVTKPVNRTVLVAELERLWDDAGG